MKNHGFGLWTLLAAMLVSGSAFAQTNTFRAEVPFAFVLGNQELPAGTYQFERLLGRPADSDSIGMIAVRDREHNIYKVVVTALSDANGRSSSACKLVFHQSAGKHYLAQMIVAGDRRSQTLEDARRETQVAAQDSPDDEIAMAQLR